MSRLIAALIRHGDYHQLPNTPSAHQPFPLTGEGESQTRKAAQAMARTLEQEHWSLVPEVDSSRMLRAWQTAQIYIETLSRRFPSPPSLQSYDELAERSLGSGANLTTGQIEAILKADPRFETPPPDWKSNSHYCLPLQGAESLMAAGERVAGHLRSRLQALPRTGEDQVKLFVGHGASIRHAAFHLGVLAFEDIARLSMYHALPVYIEYLDDGRWVHAGGEWKVRRQPDAHLD